MNGKTVAWVIGIVVVLWIAFDDDGGGGGRGARSDFLSNRPSETRDGFGGSSGGLGGASESRGNTGDLPTDLVVEVIDGDTVELETRGRTRLIGVDTPEEGECYDKAATRFTRQQLEGELVGVELDESINDKYGRLLAYLYRDGMFNATLLREGYARLLIIPPNDKYEAQFERAERSAKRFLDGLWLTCDRPEPKPPSVGRRDRDGSDDDGGGGGGGGGGGTTAIPENCDEVIGPIPTPPGDPTGLDGDGDGTACE